MLSSIDAKKIFPASFLEDIIGKLKTEPMNKRKKNTIKESLILFAKKKTPNSIKKLIPVKKPYLSLDNNLLAFRLYIIIFMHRLLQNETSHI